MSSMSEDIQCAGSDTRPPMLDRTDFESWQQRIRLYCLGKDNGENIMDVINEGPLLGNGLQLLLLEELKVQFKQGPSTYNKGLYSLINHYTDAKDIGNVKMILEGSDVTRMTGNPQFTPMNLNTSVKQGGNHSTDTMLGGQNRGGIINPGPAKPIKCYNCNGLGHIARECPRPKRLQDSDYFKDKMLLMQAQRIMILLSIMDIFEADECDAFDSDVDEGPTTQTMFMTNLTSEDRIYDEAGPSYDSNTPYEVQDHDTFVNHLDEYHEVHEMQTDEQHNYVVNSDADYTSNSNIIPYDQYVEDNEDHVV
ncbi:integrase, catalytic region, zinc finger, CCHC-type containing protein [Tanacetum coccineum]